MGRSTPTSSTSSSSHPDATTSRSVGTSALDADASRTELPPPQDARSSPSVAPAIASDPSGPDYLESTAEDWAATTVDGHAEDPAGHEQWDLGSSGGIEIFDGAPHDRRPRKKGKAPRPYVREEDVYRPITPPGEPSSLLTLEDHSSADLRPDVAQRADLDDGVRRVASDDDAERAVLPTPIPDLHDEQTSMHPPWGFDSSTSSTFGHYRDRSSSLSSVASSSTSASYALYDGRPSTSYDNSPSSSRYSTHQHSPALQSPTSSSAPYESLADRFEAAHCSSGPSSRRGSLDNPHQAQQQSFVEHFPSHSAYAPPPLPRSMSDDVAHYFKADDSRAPSFLTSAGPTSHTYPSSRVPSYGPSDSYSPPARPSALHHAPSFSEPNDPSAYYPHSYPHPYQPPSDYYEQTSHYSLPPQMPIIDADRPHFSSAPDLRMSTPRQGWAPPPPPPATTSHPVIYSHSQVNLSSFEEYGPLVGSSAYDRTGRYAESGEPSSGQDFVAAQTGWRDGEWVIKREE
ncbi:putative C6 finger domain protein [Pseudohyphozyma bogoriensis]|nr:putative C6 finger domain protein [Pseudohyphozyma bogoriensis]